MKKFYALFAAALMSASLFAAAPTAADLAKEYDVVNNVVLCINPIEDAKVCNDIRFVGTPNNWGKGDPIGTDPDTGDPIYGPESFDNCEKFMPVPGFDGWYAAELPYSEGFEGKPLQEPTDRVWTWDYQCGDMDSWVFVDGNQMNLVAGFDGECNISYASAGAYIYQLKYWKKHKTPCAPVIKHTYTINLYAPDACPDMVPTIAGDFEGWNGTAMNEELDEEFNTVYTISFVDQEGHGFKFKAGAAGDWSNEMQYYDTINDAWANFGNYELGADSIIVLDYSNNDMYRFAKCDASPIETVEVSVKLPAENFPVEGVEIIGTFDDWAGAAMAIDGDVYKATVEAKASQYFKFRSAGKWPGEEGGTEIEVYRAEIDDWTTIQNNELVFGQLWEGEVGARTLYLDLSDADAYRWQAREEQGIENVVLTEKAHKVMVDGVMYIIRDNKMFNVQGTQVR